MAVAARAYGGTGMSNDEEHWYPQPWNPNELWPSVTTILGATMTHGGLPAWYAREAARYAVDNHTEMAMLLAEGRAGDAVTIAANEPARIKEKAADLGTLVHRVAEAITKNQPISLTEEEGELVDPYLDTLARYAEEMQPTYEWAEATVHHKWLKYSGTCDAGIRYGVPVPVVSYVGELIEEFPPGALLVNDYKTGTGKSIRFRAGPQVVGYTGCTHMDVKDGLGTIVPMPRADGAAVVHLAPEGYRVHGVRVTPGALAAFAAARSWFGWIRGEGEDIIGLPTVGGRLRIDDIPGLDTRVKNTLALAGVATLADLEMMGEAAFKAIKYAGPKAVETARRLLAVEGRSWPAKAEVGVA